MARTDKIVVNFNIKKNLFIKINKNKKIKLN